MMSTNDDYPREETGCVFHDHPYSSPSEDSENDENDEDMNFSVYSMERSVELDSGNTEQQLCGSSHLTSTTAAEVQDRDTIQSLDWCHCGQCSPCMPEDAVCCHDRPEVLDFMNTDKGCITGELFFQVQLMSEEGLQYNRLIYASLIKDDFARHKDFEQRF